MRLLCGGCYVRGAPKRDHMPCCEQCKATVHEQRLPSKPAMVSSAYNEHMAVQKAQGALDAAEVCGPFAAEVCGPFAASRARSQHCSW